MNILLPDACSFIYLSDIFIGNQHITNFLTRTFHVNTSTEVFWELRRQRKRIVPYDQEILQLVSSTRKRFYRQQDYEDVLFRNFSPKGNPDKNRGERTTCSLALYLVRKRLANQVIILTDDMKAVNGLIEWFEKHFIGVDVWGSLDLLLHLYLTTFPKWPLAQTKAALRTVNSRIGGRDPVKRLSDYNKRIQATNKMLRDLPGIRVESLL